MAVKQSINVMAVLLQILVIAIAFNSGDAVRCFVCNSATDYEGEACKTVQKYDNTSTGPTPDFLMDCEKDFPDDLLDYARCRVIVQDVDGDVRIIRSCATWADRDKQVNRCIDRTGTAKIKIQYCECDGDGCNGASALYASSALTIILAAFISKPFF